MYFLYVNIYANLPDDFFQSLSFIFYSGFQFLSNLLHSAL